MTSLNCTCTSHKFCGHAGPHTNLLSGKFMFIYMHDIDSADEQTCTLCLLYSGINILVVELPTLYVKIQHNDNIICGARCQNVAGL